ncbi:MAG: FAD-binding and (Fe-S)-binding domain-containing protein [Candidatus Endonucleobacter bathymodioli]|uniref:D-2-hydroxyglutarate dehydrogenase n=1 Tax=Candidatus Endonucleibacter bathymodioli TaxID=539814 RepID=A0AA90SXN5_9GAMM|nr:FAD-binding and (Fe-S)-binding domain-containing protein [Candidatus Endonucleobacter bathymodioli]
MIKRIDNKIASELYRSFADTLHHDGFTGDITLNFSDRVALATDNSIYQILPEGVLYPASTEDLSILMRLAGKTEYTLIVLSPRGGGTGTNGQSLTNGFMVDTSRYMNKILEINPQERWARVQAGVVKDQLNELTAEQGLFFAPELSTSNRATIGGMVNTDASGQGSVIYGKTRDHVLELTSVMSDGSIWKSFLVTEDEFDSICKRKDFIANIHKVVASAHDQNKNKITTSLPKLKRNLTGYDLANIRKKDGRFDLNATLCGSEGTLAIISEIKVNLLPLPTAAALILVFYKSFQASLQDAHSLMAAIPDSIETIDSMILGLAQADKNLWKSVHSFFPDTNEHVDGINFVEYTGSDESQIDEGINRLMVELKKFSPADRVGYKIVRGKDDVAKIWNMRKHAVGLLGNLKGDARPIPFVEDVAVPPENLAEFIQEFRAILSKHQLRYGMFGHVDAGVLHVRPAIDMKDPQQALLIRSISDQVFELSRKYGGALWGEHGKGIRSEYAPLFFADLYPALQNIKSAFDPHNKLNPGKIATPKDHNTISASLLKIDEVPTRGENDREIERNAFEAFGSSMYCNGNGACFNYNPNSAMCPTWKATHDRAQSPKGRSGLVREWLRLQSLAGADLREEQEQIRQSSAMSTIIKTFISKSQYLFPQKLNQTDFSHDVYKALDSCMSCKSCAGQCPVQVNIPDLRSKFFELYHGRYPRPLKHHFAAMLESWLPSLAKIRWIYNWATRNSILKRVIAQLTGLTDLPIITTSSPLKECTLAGADTAYPNLLQTISDTEREKTVIIVQDAFTSFFETSLLTNLVEFLIHLGYKPLIAPFRPNGKILHVYGFLSRFEKTAETNASELIKLMKSGIPLVGVDAAVTLTYRDEYKEVLGSNAPNVQLLSEWFSNQISTIRQLNIKCKGSYVLLSHCTEATNNPASITQWQALFEAFDLQLKYQPTGCCGMSGIYGHESCNQKVSRKLYDISWKNVLENVQNTGRVIATGYSCRSQIKRYTNTQVDHPVQALFKAIKAQH